ncbi:transglutaminase-like domain-containing protein [Hyphomicrobium facile]|uniref:Transglutaminase-like enzyme, putative cysteine protease n=1 Tax=Hyphomicrobium facile TaxID=51670 RepID=A0A1I7NW77_9HYPH|nr:transglutaminase family protein [Hyphomicrobium facile]SFV38902.1 Transglutaminase-like enzyme, putative cysteine protease [Hyphomicrobium facile]
MLIHVGYDIGLQLDAPTPLLLLLDVHPSRRRDIVYENALNVPDIPIERGLDLYGNRTQRLVAPAGPLKLSYRAVVRDPGVLDETPLNAREIPIPDLPNYAMHFLSGSRYCETDELTPIAWQLFGNVSPGYARVKAICEFVHNHIKFDYQAARSTRTAAEAYKEGTGVCRDFAHLAIAFCRCLNIPAAYVNGFLGDIGVPPDPAPMDFSAWFEAYIDHRWVTFDARHNAPRTGRVVIARGRDAADVAMITSFGQHYLGEFKVVCEEVAPQRAEQLTSHAA